MARQDAFVLTIAAKKEYASPVLTLCICQIKTQYGSLKPDVDFGIFSITVGFVVSGFKLT